MKLEEGEVFESIKTALQQSARKEKKVSIEELMKKALGWARYKDDYGYEYKSTGFLTKIQNVIVLIFDTVSPKSCSFQLGGENMEVECSEDNRVRCVRYFRIYGMKPYDLEDYIELYQNEDEIPAVAVGDEVKIRDKIVKVREVCHDSNFFIDDINLPREYNGSPVFHIASGSNKPVGIIYSTYNSKGNVQRVSIERLDKECSVKDLTKFLETLRK